MRSRSQSINGSSAVLAIVHDIVLVIFTALRQEQATTVSSCSPQPFVYYSPLSCLKGVEGSADVGQSVYGVDGCLYARK